MIKKIIQKISSVSIINFIPLTLFATRGPEDYGIIMALMAMVFTVPFSLVLIILIVYLSITLKKNNEIKQNEGQRPFIFSLIIILLSLILPFVLIYKATNHFKMFQLIAGVFLPVIILAVISLLLAYNLKKR